jgi:hypothetical protein
MTDKRPRIDRSQVRTVSADERPSKVRLDDEARPLAPGSSFADFLASLPSLLGAADLRDAIAAAARAHAGEGTLLWG